MKRILTTASAALLALGTAASASTFTLNNGTAGLIPGGTATNEVLTNVFSQSAASGYYGADIVLDADSNIDVAFFGFEAGFRNSFVIGGTTTTTADIDGLNGGVSGDGEEYAEDLATPLSSFTLNNVTSGLLDFSFFADLTGDNIEVANGSNPDNSATNPNFFVSEGRGSAGQTLFLFFDDGGAGNDDNHDDLVVRLSIGDGNTDPSPVPLPATGLLLLGALGGMRMMKRRS